MCRGGGGCKLHRRVSPCLTRRSTTRRRNQQPQRGAARRSLQDGSERAGASTEAALSSALARSFAAQRRVCATHHTRCQQARRVRSCVARTAEQPRRRQQEPSHLSQRVLLARWHQKRKPAARLRLPRHRRGLAQGRTAQAQEVCRSAQLRTQRSRPLQLHLRHSATAKENALDPRRRSNSSDNRRTNSRSRSSPSATSVPSLAYSLHRGARMILAAAHLHHRQATRVSAKSWPGEVSLLRTMTSTRLLASLPAWLATSQQARAPARVEA